MPIFIIIIWCFELLDSHTQERYCKEKNMRTTGKKLVCCSSRNSFLVEINSQLSSTPKHKNIGKYSKKLCISKLHSRRERIGTKENDTLGKFIESLPKIPDRHSAKFVGKEISNLDDQNMKNESCDGAIGRPERKKRRKRKKKKKNIVRDGASCLQRRARYLLIKMKLELNLIDAYSGDGWKGQSKEKIKPEKELQRAGKQIVKCKLGIRDTIRQLDLLCSEVRIADSVMDPDGSVFHEYIFCAKCKSREAFPDDDIILCDGTCNCAFHQKCLDPPLEKIPPADQGWLCKICELKMEILEAINAHIGTSFTVNNSWEDIFKEAILGPSTENTSLNPDDEWPSEDSDDEDYDPELVENSNSITVIEESMCDDASSLSSLFCLSDEARSCSTSYKRLDVKSKSTEDCEAVDSAIRINSDECSDHEITRYRRKRRDVDYKKLHDEMFGKELNDSEQQSEDEDWGSQRRKQRRELDADPMMACGDEDGSSNMIVHENISQGRRKLFRIPHDAVERLRQVFAKNELPSRSIKENLAMELGISAEKVGKWFKNARYAALRIRKEEMTNEPQTVYSTKRSIRKAGKPKLDGEESLDNSYLLPLSSIVRMPKSLRKILKRKKSSISSPLKRQYNDSANALPTDKTQVLNVSQCLKEAFSNQGRTSSQVEGITENEKLYLVEMERLFSLEERIQNLMNTLLTCNYNGRVPNRTDPKEQNVMFVPVVVEVKEKPLKHISPWREILNQD